MPSTTIGAGVEQTKADTEFLARELAALRLAIDSSPPATTCAANWTTEVDGGGAAACQPKKAGGGKNASAQKEAGNDEPEIKGSGQLVPAAVRAG